jgi:hypothetical protein
LNLLAHFNVPLIGGLTILVYMCMHDYSVEGGRPLLLIRIVLVEKHF